jgi:hypothetical protein
MCEWLWTHLVASWPLLGYALWAAALVIIVGGIRDAWIAWRRRL